MKRIHFTLILFIAGWITTVHAESPPTTEKSKTTVAPSAESEPASASKRKNAYIITRPTPQMVTEAAKLYDVNKKINSLLLDEKTINLKSSKSASKQPLSTTAWYPGVVEQYRTKKRILWVSYTADW